MSAFGRAPQISQEGLQAIREVIDELRNLGNATRDAKTATEDRTQAEERSFVESMARKKATKAGRDFAFGVGGDVLEFGLDAVLGGGSVSFNALRAAANAGIPQARNLLEPIEAATARVTAQFSGPARAGAQFSPEVLQFQFDRALAEEQRAKQLERAAIEMSRPYALEAAEKWLQSGGQLPGTRVFGSGGAAGGGLWGQILQQALIEHGGQIH